MLRALLLFCCLLLFRFCSAQDTTVYFLKNSGTIVNTKDSANYVRFVISPIDNAAERLFEVHELYLNGKPKLIGKSSDKFGYRLYGTCIEYYSSGKKQRISTATDNQITGDESDYYPNGKLYLIRKYDPTCQCTHLDECRDSSGTVLLKEGTGTCPVFSDDFKVLLHKDLYKNSKKDGVWKRDVVVDNDSLHVEMTFSEDELKEGISTSTSGMKYVFKKEETQAEYIKGQAVMYDEIRKYLIYPYMAKQKKVTGRVIVTCQINIDGSMSNIKILRSPSYDLSNEVLKMIKWFKLWVPATRYGKAMTSNVTIPFDFSLN